ncbi:Uncharacterised protein [Mycobacterium tuberculosis]|nr:Uncharacterised protein [Mycobacterium tuberculosis]
MASTVLRTRGSSGGRKRVSTTNSSDASSASLP